MATTAIGTVLHPVIHDTPPPSPEPSELPYVRQRKPFRGRRESYNRSQSFPEADGDRRGSWGPSNMQRLNSNDPYFLESGTAAAIAERKV